MKIVACSIAPNFVEMIQGIVPFDPGNRVEYFAKTDSEVEAFISLKLKAGFSCAILTFSEVRVVKCITESIKL